MSSILYYSNHCEYSKKLLQFLSKTSISKDVHFICIDKRIKGPDNKTYIILENGKRILFSDKIERVPALLLLNGNNQILYGDYIYNNFKSPQVAATKAATSNNMEPMAFSFGNAGGCGIVSDQFSFLDMDPESLNTKGDGGLRQMHSYVTLNQVESINTPAKDEFSNKSTSQMTIAQLQNQRDADLKR